MYYLSSHLSKPNETFIAVLLSMILQSARDCLNVYQPCIGSLSGFQIETLGGLLGRTIYFSILHTKKFALFDCNSVQIKCLIVGYFGRNTHIHTHAHACTHTKHEVMRKYWLICTSVFHICLSPGFLSFILNK